MTTRLALTLLLLSTACETRPAAKPATPAAPAAATADSKPVPPPAAAPAAPSAEATAQFLAAIPAFADRVCACADMPCVMGESSKMQEKFKGFRPTPELREQVMPDLERLSRCAQELQTKSASAPPAPTADDPEKGEFTLEEATAGLAGKGKLVATIATTKGDLRCELLDDVAPRTVANFVGLARGVRPFKDLATGEWVKRPLYDGTAFHRVVSGFMIQGGDPKSAKYDGAPDLGTGGPGYSIQDEFQPKLRFDGPGLLAMAHSSAPHSGGSQFFITDAAAAFLNGQYALFGRCAPHDVIKAIATTPAGPPDEGGKPSRPLEAVTMKVTISRK